LFISSAHVYGPVSREAPRVREDTPLGPRGAYGKTKVAGEEAVRRAAANGADAVVIRAFQHTGPRQNPRMMLPQWARQFALGCDPVEVFTRDAYVDLTDVRDVVRAYRLVVEKGRCGEIYNVGSGTCRRSGDILALLQRLADPGRSIVETSPGVKQEPIADITRVAHLTGWHPAVPLEETVADTLAYWRGVAGRQSR
jgi:GDP-4-dehydro-6-deoxy-D-mannose reductase